MDATPGNAGHQMAEGRRTGGAIALKWAALHDAGTAVARLARLADAPMDRDPKGLPLALATACGSHRRLAGQGMDDLAAIMEAGLSALLAVQARGGDPVPGARALWEEFRAAREALLLLLPASAE